LTKATASKRTNDALVAIRGISGGNRGKGVSRLIYERLRLAIVSALAVKESLSFSELKSLLDTSDGNLSVHARKLEEAGLIRCKKQISDRMPKTEYSITPKGRKALNDYLEHMEKLVKSMK
jgi:DNA-binding HxlR family transcriptional regulator